MFEDDATDLYVDSSQSAHQIQRYDYTWKHDNDGHFGKWQTFWLSGSQQVLDSQFKFLNGNPYVYVHL